MSTEREVFAVQIDSEIRLVVLVEDERSRRLPGERRPGTDPDRLPEPLQIYVSLKGSSLRWSTTKVTPRYCVSLDVMFSSGINHLQRLTIT